jgi:hypothetical protein
MFNVIDFITQLPWIGGLFGSCDWHKVLIAFHGMHGWRCPAAGRNQIDCDQKIAMA